MLRLEISFPKLQSFSLLSPSPLGSLFPNSIHSLSIPDPLTITTVTVKTELSISHLTLEAAGTGLAIAKSAIASRLPYFPSAGRQALLDHRESQSVVCGSLINTSTH